MKRWQSHKIVEAGVIKELGAGRVLVESPDAPASEATATIPATAQGHEWIEVPGDIFARGTPVEGFDYLVRYSDGYISWSPSAAFLEGYSELDLPPEEGE